MRYGSGLDGDDALFIRDEQGSSATAVDTSSSTAKKYRMNFNAHNSNAIYTDNGKVLPLSISKQSYIIYK